MWVSIVIAFLRRTQTSNDVPEMSHEEKKKNERKINKPKCCVEAIFAYVGDVKLLNATITSETKLQKK